jgi:D-alanine-D-alanine ligase
MGADQGGARHRASLTRRKADSRAWKVAVIANLQGEREPPASSPPEKPVDTPADAEAEYDKPSTVAAIREVIESAGHRASFLPADRRLPVALVELKPDICFNIAEGFQGDGREAQVPALLEMMGIPYTASRVVAHAISLEKTLTKRIWRDMGLPVTPFQEFVFGDESLRAGLSFPLFVKPTREGTGMGIDPQAVVHDKAELRQRVRWIIETYAQPALVEPYLPGREFTLGILGRKDAAEHSLRPEIYDKDGYFRFPIAEIASDQSVTPGVYGYQAKVRAIGDAGAVGYHCPAQIDPRLEERMRRLVRRAHRAIGALDVSRVDIRLDAEGEPRLMEINTLPGLAPDYSDLSLMAGHGGLAYRDLILEILYLAAARFGMLD